MEFNHPKLQEESYHIIRSLFCGCFKAIKFNVYNTPHTHKNTCAQRLHRPAGFEPATKRIKQASGLYNQAA